VPGTVANDVLLLLQVPPVGLDVNVEELPTQDDAVPVIAAGNGLTVNTAVVKHPVGNVYVIVELPAVNVAVTSPVNAPIPATEVVPLVQLPPPASVSRLVEPAHVLSVPDIAAGNGLIVIGVVLKQPKAEV